jgi:acyl-CoA synthetase (AMP-forming)/AMP-acid ligase II
MNVAELLLQQTARRPDATAIIDRVRSVTFAQLEYESRGIAAELAGRGLQPGDVVLVFCPMSVSLYAALLAIFRLGLVGMFVDPSSGREHIERCCDVCPPKAFLGTPTAHLLRLVSPAIRRIPIRCMIGGRRRRGAGPFDPWPCQPSAPALMTFTTGSTGEPKAALRTHGFLRNQHLALRDSLQIIEGDIDLTTLPVFVLANLASGVTSLIPDADLRRPGAIEPARIVRQIHRHRATRVVASPAFLSRLSTYCLARGETLDGLSRIFTGGGPVVPRALDRLAATAPAARISAVYGSTEAEPIALARYRDLGNRERELTRTGAGLLAGVPVGSIDVRIIPDRGEPIDPVSPQEFDNLCLDSDRPGEIVVAGEHVLSGYWRGHGDAETKVTVGDRRWHRTGDAGYFDASGRLWLLGRCAAAIEDARGRLYPFAVEAAAEDRDEVERAALIGNEEERVLIVQSAAHDRRRVIAELHEHLAFAALDDIRIVPQIPVDLRHNSKIDYARLRRSLTSAA